MEESLKHPHLEETAALADQAAHDAPPDPTHHILDKVLVGLDSTTGQWKFYPYDDHFEAREGYVPAMAGPFKLEFTKHMGNVTVVAVLFLVAGLLVARRIRSALEHGKAPHGPLANAFEAIVLFIRDEVVVPVGGHSLGRYTPLFLTYFLFILLANLLGMIPEFGTATGNISVTLAMGGSIYGLVWLLGMWNQGPFKYLLHMVPPGTPLWMWPLMFVLELMGPLIKCFVLAVRLFANMIAGHLIIGTVLSLGAIGGMMPVGLAGLMLVLGIPLALGISLLELLVAFIQAYVFTLLAVVFIGAAVHPEH